jgi:ABC-type glycerol-3-phosphate transport system permease component
MTSVRQPLRALGALARTNRDSASGAATGPEREQATSAAEPSSVSPDQPQQHATSAAEPSSVSPDQSEHTTSAAELSAVSPDQREHATSAAGPSAVSPNQPQPHAMSAAEPSSVPPDQPLQHATSAAEQSAVSHDLPQHATSAAEPSSVSPDQRELATSAAKPSSVSPDLRGSVTGTEEHSRLTLRQARRVVWRTGLTVVTAAGAVFAAFPLLWMISTSLKSDQEANGPRLVWWPANPQLTAYGQILADPAFVRAYVNSMFVAALAISGTLVSVAAVAYAFSRIEWPGRNLIFGLMLATLMVPAPALIVPQYVMFSAVGWIGSFNPVIIPGFFAGGAALIFLLRQFMAQLPKELDEAAEVDGAGHVRIWWNVVLPQCLPALATIATFLFVGVWNSLLQPVIYLQTSGLYTLPVYVSSLFNPQQTSQPWPTIMAASVLTTLPLILIFMYAQRYVVDSIAVTGLK